MNYAACIHVANYSANRAKYAAIVDAALEVRRCQTVDFFDVVERVETVADLGRPMGVRAPEPAAAVRPHSRSGLSPWAKSGF